MKKKVSISRCAEYDDNAVYEGISGAVALMGGMDRFVRPGERILLKPNLLAAKPPEAAVTTHPSVVRALIRLVKEAGATPVVGDSPGLGGALKVAGRCGVLDVCKEEGVEFRDLKTPVMVENPGGRTFKRLEVAAEVLDVDGVINLPKLKTHVQMLLTLGVKNIFGCVPGKLKPQWHLSAGVDRACFAAMILDLYLFVNPRLTVMDGVVGMEGNGPSGGEPRPMGLIFAAGDAVSMDVVIAEVLGISAGTVPLQRTAEMRGIEGSRLEDIEILGERVEDVRVEGFKLPPFSDTNFVSKLPYFLETRLRKALTSRPHVANSACTLCNVCVNVCPAEVMENIERIRIDYDNCIRCYCCQEMCPQGAITSKQGWLKRIIPGL
ncbi:MAG: DUF362 domain-containing protein [Thermodesulfobacteriota bacterium]|nr:MAG: DUF362 domain-containing protein [Thermodesulfobacteriota bacterium]